MVHAVFIYFEMWIANAITNLEIFKKFWNTGKNVEDPKSVSMCEHSKWGGL